MARSAVDKTPLRKQFETLGQLTPPEAVNFLQGVYFFDANCANYWMNGTDALLEQRLNHTARVLYGSGRLANTPVNLEQFYDGRFVANVASSAAAESCPNFSITASQSEPSIASQLDSSGTVALISVSLKKESANLDTEATYALDQVLSSARQGDTFRIDATFRKDNTLPFVESKVSAVEQYVAKKLPSAKIRSTLSPGNSGRPNIRVSIN